MMQCDLLSCLDFILIFIPTLHSNLKDIINIFCVLSIRIVSIQMCVQACELFTNADKEKVWVSFITLPFLLRWHLSLNLELRIV